MDPASFLESFGTLFYIVSTNRTSFETVEEVPHYTGKAIPNFFVLFLVEQIYMKLKKKRTGRVNDMVISAGQGAIQEIIGILLYGWRLYLYTYIYSNWRIITLPWNSLWTWWICFFIVDFLYYVAHRACHEINFLWAAHQVHHSSEDYNLFVALRQSGTLNLLQWVFYLPMALAIPPSAYLVHNYLNLLYQFWIHTEAVKSIGPLEYILNTPSHHRVHHGRNKYCIDKNYAGVLIIWDRMFGTFQAEEETVVYGLTHNLNTFNPIDIQLGHFKYIWKTFHEMDGWKNKMSVLVKGPGWSPGKPRLGNPEDIPEIEYPVKKYDPQLPLWKNVYVILHALSFVFMFHQVTEFHQDLPVLVLYAMSAFMLIYIASISYLLENRNCSGTELLRCMLYFALENYYLLHSKIAIFPPPLLMLNRLIHMASAFIWIGYFCSNVKITLHPFTKKIH